jgi:hypothetical protein
MLKGILVCALFAVQCVFAAPIVERKIDQRAVLQLAEQLGISSEENLLEQTQKQWLRKPGTERWDMSEFPPEKRDIVLNWAKKEGIYDAWNPSRKIYDKAIILGATAEWMQRRFDYFIDLWKQGIRVKEIVWLTGERPLIPGIDGLADRCANESEVARVFWKEADLPDDMRNVSVQFFDLPMEGSKRPTTADTIIVWAKENPEPCSVLVISDQPFCGYQYAVTETYLPDQIDFELVGKSCDLLSHPLAAPVTLDSLARWIYQENQVALR